MELRTKTDWDEEHRATEMKVLGIHDQAGTMIAGTASSRSGKGVSVVFQPDATGLYYIAVGSDGDDRTGVYRIRETEEEVASGSRQGRSVDQDQQGSGGGDKSGSDKSGEKDEKTEEQNSPATGACHHRDGAGGRDPDGGHVGHIRLRWTGRGGVGYQWMAGGVDFQGATGASYTLTEDEEGKAIRVKVSFTDDAGNAEELTSPATEAAQPPPPSPATVQPAITGTSRVGETLTADTSGISDADGMENASFTYR